MDDCQPVALRASARYVSIAAVDSRLVSSSVERRRLNRVNLLPQIIDGRKLLALDHSLIPQCDGGSWPSFTIGAIRSARKAIGDKPLCTPLGRHGRI